MTLNPLHVAVLAFLAAAWIALVAILRLAPGAYADALRLPPGRGWAPELAFLAALSLRR